MDFRGIREPSLTNQLITGPGSGRSIEIEDIKKNELERARPFDAEREKQMIRQFRVSDDGSRFLVSNYPERSMATFRPG